ncbi:hypothetical protein E4U11_005504 [Claviceps purpurea]|nr:hypothetical protein E4U11_005504 [Claviceps purpurea]
MSGLELILKELQKEKHLRQVAEEDARVTKIERQVPEESLRAAKESLRAAKERTRAAKERTRAAKERTRAAKIERRVAEESLRAAEEENKRIFGPLTVKEYAEECHTLDGKLDVVTEFTLVIEGPVVDSGDRPRPRLIVPWKGFPQKQRESLKKLPSDHKFPRNQNWTTRIGLKYVAKMLKPVDSEYSLAINREEVVTRPIELLMKEVRQNAEIRTSFGIDVDVKFERNVNHGETKPRSHSTELRGKTSIADEFCSIKRSSTGESEIVLAVQYKLPQKLPVSLLVAALDNTTEINLDTGIIDEDGEEFGPKQLVAAVIAQLFSVLVSKGLRFGYIDTGEAKVFLHIGDDPSRIEYHLSCPTSDVQGEETMHLSAVSQLFAFVVQAIEAPKPTKEWEIAASELPLWKLKRVEIREMIPRIAEQPCEEADSRSPGKKPVSWDRTSIHRRAVSRSTHHSPDEVNNEKEASDFGSKTVKELPQNVGIHKRPDSRQDVFDGLYCTHECVWGLAFSGPLDKNCPNVKDHGSKHIDRQEFLRLMGEQLVGDKAHAYCKPINASGHIGYLFKIRLLSHGYTLVAKAVALGDGATLIYEEKMYDHLRDLQGRFIPACPGRVELNGIFQGVAYYYTAFRHFLFLSYAGQPVLKALSEVDNSVVSQVLATLAQLHQHRVMHHDAAPRNMLYDDCTGRYMVVDLEMSKPIDEEVLEAVNGCRKKRKTKRETERELKTASENFAAESQSLLAKLLPSAGTCCRRFEHVDSPSRILVYMEFTPLYAVH